jgi:hypothetical protein
MGSVPSAERIEIASPGTHGMAFEHCRKGTLHINQPGRVQMFGRESTGAAVKFCRQPRPEDA